MDVEEEEKRRGVAELIEETLRFDFGKWPKCKVTVFGSSYSRFGSPDSDLDLCLMTDRWKCDDVFPDEIYTQANAALDNLYNKDGSEAEEKLLQTSKRRKNDLFILKAILEEQGNEILAVVSHARVPILRFRYTQYGLDYKCDLCFDNELGLLNTRLLRAYASFDDRARDLGVAVKYWAKQRGIADAASGCLSSYSIMLMSIYYLQRVKVLPNLQESQLVRLSKTKTKYYQQDDISFCENQEIARLYLENTTVEGGALDKSLSALVLGFFQFYTTQFDSVTHVVAIRSPFPPMKKVKQWGTKAKTWRLSIQDPIQTSRDVGGVLHFSSQQKLSHELRRAFELLEDGASYLCEVCLKA
eukprot:jgi/Phyca11/16734/fgenesh1_pg.PHYCAscaffold_22_\